MLRCKLVAYYRVSTAKQGESGLGLESQQAKVAAHAATSGCQVVKEFTEIESGRKSDRPELAKAIAYAKKHKATLVIAKLDRLARNVAFIANLMDGGVEFVACDNPTATRLTLHILAAVAEDEARQISERTKSALAAAKARGQKLGAARMGSHLTAADRAKGAAVNRDLAVNDVAALAVEIQRLRSVGKSLRAIAADLNEAGHTTRQGSVWNAIQVKRVLDRLS